MNWPVEQPRVVRVKPLKGFLLELAFNDGTVGETDLADVILGRGGVISALEDPAFFKSVRVNPEAGTIEWPNEVDLCPDVLYSRVTGQAIPFAVPQGGCGSTAAYPQPQS